MTSFPHSIRARQFLLDNLPFALLIEPALVNVAPVGHPLRPSLLEAAQGPLNGPPRDPKGLDRIVLREAHAEDPLDKFFSPASASLCLG